VGSFADAARFAELAVLAVKGTVAADAVRAAGVAILAGKLVIDATNPIAEAPPVDGVLSFSRISTSRCWSACSASLRRYASSRRSTLSAPIAW